jgi:serine/threonine protein kinase
LDFNFLFFNFTAWSLIKAIDGIHDANVCHRDLKPDNIVIRNKNGETKLTIIDFNVAVDLDMSPAISGNTGLKQWSAPETRSNPIYSSKCDIWSFGCLVYFMHIKKSPFSKLTISEESVIELLE